MHSSDNFCNLKSTRKLVDAANSDFEKVRCVDFYFLWFILHNKRSSRELSNELVVIATVIVNLEILKLVCSFGCSDHVQEIT
jgi:hypothetical protein